MYNLENKRPLKNVITATISVLNRTPVLSHLDGAMKTEIGEGVYKHLAGVFADKEKISDNCNWPYISTALKNLPLFCVMTEKHLDLLGQHIQRELFPIQDK